MIRFSAGLVVVAIGVLIGGVTTSKLSLVYVAIAVSAVALVVLAIGVALKREELFGGGPELAPAGAGAGSGTPAGQSAGTGHVQGSDGHVREDQEQVPRHVPGPATAAFEAAAAASAAAAPAPASSVGAPTVEAPSATPLPVTTPSVGAPVGSRASGNPALGNPALGNPPLGQRRPAFSQASTRVDETVADWDTRPPQPSWSPGDQSRPTWMPKEPTPKEAASRAPSAKEPPSGATGTTSASLRAWESPEQPPTVPAAVARAGSLAAAPSWFDKLNQPVVDSAARTDTEPTKSQPSATSEPLAAAETVAAETVAAPTVSVPSDLDTADDDDWPTRYSWLDDDESDEADTSDKPATVAEVAEAVEPEAAPVDDVTDPAPAEAKAAEVKGDEPKADQPKSAEPAAAEVDAPGPLDAEVDANHDAKFDTDHDADTEAEAEVDADASEDPTPAAHKDSAADSGAELSETLAVGHDNQPPSEQQTGTRLVTVIPGVPRYHDPDCILIRFMDEDDIARKSIPEAQAANCTPCAACQPEG